MEGKEGRTGVMREIQGCNQALLKSIPLFLLNQNRIIHFSLQRIFCTVLNLHQEKNLVFQVG